MAKSHYFELVYDVTSSIPEGRVTSYGAIADYLALGSARMVGWALKNSGQQDTNVPAHRVLNRLGELTGRLSFRDPDEMQRLLEGEGIEVKENKVVRFKELFWHPEELGNF